MIYTQENGTLLKHETATNQRSHQLHVFEKRLAFCVQETLAAPRADLKKRISQDAHKEKPAAIYVSPEAGPSPVSMFFLWK